MEYSLAIHPHNPKHYNVMTATSGPGLSGLTATKKLVTAYIRHLIGVTGKTCMVRGALCDMHEIDRDLLQDGVKEELQKLRGWLAAEGSGPLAETFRHWLQHAHRGCLALHELGAEDGKYGELPFLITFLRQLELWCCTHGSGWQIAIGVVPDIVPVRAALDTLFEYAKEWDDALTTASES